MTTTWNTSNNNHRITQIVAVIVMLLMAPAILSAQAAGSGTREANRIERRVNSQSTSSSAQEEARDAVAEAAEKAGEDHPDDPDKVKEAVQAKIDELKEEEKNHKETVQWLEKLARELQDKGYLRAEIDPGAAGSGTVAAAETERRITNQSVSSTSEENARTAAAAAAKKAGEDHPNHPEKVREDISKALDELKKEYKNSQETLKWIERLARELQDNEYVYAQGPRTPRGPAALVLTGTVTEGEMATASVIDANGATLSGVVVEVDGKDYVTDRKGRIIFPVAVGLTTLVASLPGGGGVTGVPVVPPTDAPVIPDIEGAPEFVQPGQRVPVHGSGFSGDATGNTVQFGDEVVDVLAASPTELVVATPVESPVGSFPVTVTTGRGASEPRDVTMIGIRMESGDTALRTGQKGKAFLVVEGTDEPVRLQVTNHTPQVVNLNGGETTEIRTSGGDHNSAPVKYRAVGPGGFELSAKLTESES